MELVSRKAIRSESIAELFSPYRTIKITDSRVPHPLRQFFESRRISWAKLGKYLNVPRSNVCVWMNGTRPTPKKHQQKLFELQDRILKWEAKSGKLFNSDYIK